MSEEDVNKKMVKLSEMQLDTIARTAVKMMDGITTVAETRGIGTPELEAMYKVGLGFYRTGKYEEAEKIFHFLCVIQHTCPKYWTALGGVRQARKAYDDALLAYAAAAMFDMHKPKPHYYSAQCNLALGKLDAAESGCRSLLDLCPPSPENNEFRAKAQQMIATIEHIREEQGGEPEKK